MSRVGNHEPNFTLMNILTGICVTNANKAADDDMEISTESLYKESSPVANLKRVLHAADHEGRGELTWTQLQHHLLNPTVRDYFKMMDLERWHLESFFGLLKVGDEEPTIPINQFLHGCTRLRSNVKNIDLIASVHETEEQNVRRFMELKAQMDKLRDDLVRRYTLPSSTLKQTWV